MAVMKNSLMQGISGALGTLLFRNVQGRIIVSARPSALSRSRKLRQSPVQKLNRDRFREASRYAKQMMSDPAMSEHYWQIARKLKLPNGYTAAIADYMRKTKVESVNTKRSLGKAGGRILITARKKDFPIAKINVTLTTKEGKEIEKGRAAKQHQANGFTGRKGDRKRHGGKNASRPMDLQKHLSLTRRHHYSDRNKRPDG
jgi:hypothetical protein